MDKSNPNWIKVTASLMVVLMQLWLILVLLAVSLVHLEEMSEGHTEYQVAVVKTA